MIKIMAVMGLVIAISGAGNWFLFEETQSLNKEIGEIEGQVSELEIDLVDAEAINERLVERHAEIFEKVENLNERQYEIVKEKNEALAEVQGLRTKIRSVSLAKPKIVARLATRALANGLRELERATDVQDGGKWSPAISPAIPTPSSSRKKDTKN